MTNRKNSEDVVAKGKWGEVRFAVTASGDRPAKDFLDSLDEADRAKLMALFLRIADFGRIENNQKFRKERGDIYTFKSFQMRVACFRVNRTWFLTHGFQKKSDKWQQSEHERAEWIRDEHNRASVSEGKKEK